jgi:hypothetical protein
MVGGLTTGRILIAQAAVDSMKVGVSIALLLPAAPQFVHPYHGLRYAAIHAFIPALASAYSLHLAMVTLKSDRGRHLC